MSDQEFRVKESMVVLFHRAQNQLRTVKAKLNVAKGYGHTREFQECIVEARDVLRELDHTLGLIDQDARDRLTSAGWRPKKGKYEVASTLEHIWVTSEVTKGSET